MRAEGAKAARAHPVAPGQPARVARRTERQVTLPVPIVEEPGDDPQDLSAFDPEVEGVTLPDPAAESDVGRYQEFKRYTLDADDTSVRRAPDGRVSCWSIAESFDTAKLVDVLTDRFGLTAFHVYPDVVHCPYKDDHGECDGEVFYFLFGTVVCWGLSATQEREAVVHLAGLCAEQPLPQLEVEVDEFEYVFDEHMQPNVRNDVITLNRRSNRDVKMKLAVSHAVAQSTKVSVQEARIMQIVYETKQLPDELALSGEVSMKQSRIAQLIGEVFLEKSSVNLLSTVLDTPEFFWGQPDHLASLYKGMCEYLEIDDRVQVLNSRYETLQEMLDMCRSHQHHGVSTSIEVAVIWLLVIEVILGLVQTGSIIVGWHGADDR